MNSSRCQLWPCWWCWLATLILYSDAEGLSLLDLAGWGNMRSVGRGGLLASFLWNSMMTANTASRCHERFVSAWAAMRPAIFSSTCAACHIQCGHRDLPLFVIKLSIGRLLKGLSGFKRPCRWPPVAGCRNNSAAAIPPVVGRAQPQGHRPTHAAPHWTIPRLPKAASPRPYKP